MFYSRYFMTRELICFLSLLFSLFPFFLPFLLFSFPFTLQVLASVLDVRNMTTYTRTYIHIHICVCIQHTSLPHVNSRSRMVRGSGSNAEEEGEEEGGREVEKGGGGGGVQLYSLFLIN